MSRLQRAARTRQACVQRVVDDERTRATHFAHETSEKIAKELASPANISQRYPHERMNFHDVSAMNKATPCRLTQAFNTPNRVTPFTNMQNTWCYYFLAR
ncbi:hypothetical protein [Oleiagrimonas soli]|uniref:Uncharacterized protein n=1 Tax=Oleiagrimonas soli TaxID=1543381 RepID=A0A841KQG0_9GAMM|nr:hypothetical protein [Oleiagrimonas soli]MBB6184248.1 hypothetical protein [Oleiagrimonas soli]